MRLVFIIIASAVVVCGCATSTNLPTDSDGKVHGKCVSPQNRSHVKRVYTDRQLGTLRTFALSESPKLWETVRTLKVEKSQLAVRIGELSAEMREFGRNPDSDPDVVSLRAVCAELGEAILSIYMRLEEAYLVYEKMKATPGRKEYADLMKMALENGVREADATMSRYRSMAIGK